MSQTKIPLHIVEDHNEILSFLLRSIGSKQLPFENNLLIHFDSHPDLLVNNDLKASEVYEKDILLEKVSIETWILPLVQAGHVTTVVWIKPEWSNQIDEGFYTFCIGEDANHNIKVSSPLLYYISALNYAPKEELLNPRTINLHVVAFDKSEGNLAKCTGKLMQLIREFDNKYLLDIDLDFFSTLNPFVELYPKAKTYEILKVMYEFTDNDILKCSSPKDAQNKRAQQIETMEKIFKKLEDVNLNSEDSAKIDLLKYINEELQFENLVSKETLINLLKTLIAEYEGQEIIDWTIIHDAGTTIDDPARPLPHHSDLSIALEYVEKFSPLIEALPSPQFISMARSSLDDYCPPEQVDFIQAAVCSILEKTYNPDIKYHYLDEEGEGSKEAEGIAATNASS